MHLYIRADADGKIGVGHIMRCIALAQAWKDQGGEVTFISHCESEALRVRISKEGFQFIAVKDPHPHSDDLSITLAYLNRLSPFSLHRLPTWIVLDGYHFTPEYQKSIRDEGYRLLVIDDMNHLPHYHADILLNQNINAAELTYNCDEDTILLLGSCYVLLRKEFLKYRDFKRQISERAKNILVTLGGADPDNVTLKVIESLNILEQPNIIVRIIIGPANPHLASLSVALSHVHFEAELLVNPTEMPDIMAWADVAISGAGSSCWELAFMKLPSTIIVLASNQDYVAAMLSRRGLFLMQRIIYQPLNRIDVKLMMETLCNCDTRRKLSDNCSKLIDGFGSARLIKAIRNDMKQQGKNK